MPSTLARPRRFLLTLGLAIVLAASFPLTAGAEGSGRSVLPGLAPATVVASPDRQAAWTAVPSPTAAARIAVAEASMARAAGPTTSAATVTAAAVVANVSTTSAIVAPRTPTTAPAANYSGTNRLWIPSLGISHSVAWFACTRSTPPGAGVYRWGCAGTNNTYLFGHAWSTIKPLHDAYVAGRLKTGMIAYYADGSGRVRKYRLTAIRVVTPDQTDWAIAAQPRPSMTLQTCVGAKSQYRLLVRLVAVN
ncbi:MAG: sortase [Chloroflexi bacterium]|nr:sortase [Chloroflexota bacterium]